MVKTYVENESLDSSLPLHSLNAGESYRIGFFLVGAYQEILGDIHNLFGDTDAVEVAVDGDGYRIVQQRRGDTTDVMLDYVGYQLATLRATYAERIAAAHLSPERAQELSAALEAGLTGYTYLSDEPLG
jgi:arginine decarboxylase